MARVPRIEWPEHLRFEEITARPSPRLRIVAPKRDAFVYPHVLRYRHHAEFGCHSLIPATTVQELIDGFEEARRAGGDFCVATHYWEVDARIKDTLVRFLDHAAARPDVRFVRAEALFA